LKKGDLIAAPAATGEKIDLALITNVTGNVINVVTSFAKVKVNDRLSVVSIRGAMNASHDDGDNKTEVTQPARLRVGDFLADITSWRQVQGTSSVKAVNGNEIQMDVILDGSLLNDIVGLASVDPNRIRFSNLSFLLLRLEKVLDLLPGDEVLFIAYDRLTGKTHSLSAFVLNFVAATKTLTLVIINAGDFIVRPEDIAASILFVRGSAVALIQRHDLFVSWLALGESEPMPRPCIGTEADCGCSQAKE
jgi:hypothetical protein